MIRPAPLRFLDDNRLPHRNLAEWPMVSARDCWEPAAMKRLLGLVSMLALLQVAPAIAANVYDSSYSKVGRVTSSGSKYNVYYPDYSKAGWTSPSGSKFNIYWTDYSKAGWASASGSKWNIYNTSYSKVGWVSRSGSKWNVYDTSYSKVGWVDGGRGGPAAGAAFLLLLG